MDFTGYMKVKIKWIFRRIWLNSANKIKTSESVSKQSSQLNLELNSSLRQIIAALGVWSFLMKKNADFLLRVLQQWNICFFRCISPCLKTWYRTPNVSQSLLLLAQFEKRTGYLGCLFSFQIAKTTKDFGWHLVLCICFLVTGWCNERNNTRQNILFTFQFCLSFK